MNNKSLSSFLGIFLMLINMLAMSLIDISGKILRETMNSVQIVFIYKLTLLVLMLPWILKDGLSAFKTEKIHIHIIRSFLSVLGLMFFVQGLHHIDMTDAAALENIQSIILVLIGIVFFNEEKSLSRIIAVLIGFIGAIIVINPELIDGRVAAEQINKYYGFTLIGIGFWTLNGVAVKILGRTERNKTQMFYLVFFACIWAAPAALLKWQSMEVFGLDLKIIPVSLANLSEIKLSSFSMKLIFLMALCYFIHGICYFRALQCDFSVVEPFRYSKFIFSSILGFIFFKENPSKIAYLGYSLIIVSGLILLFGEIQKHNKNKILLKAL